MPVFAEDELKVVARPIDHIITLPISATVMSLPEAGAVASPFHTFDVRPEMFNQDYGHRSPTEGAESSNQKIVFSAPVTDRMSQVFGELFRREELAKRIGDFGEKPSPFASIDPLGWTTLSEEDRKLLDSVRSATLSTLWNDSMADIRSSATKDLASGRYSIATLEDVIAGGLDQTAVRVLGAGLNVSPDKLTTYASAVLAEEVRRRNGLPWTPETPNPFALYQKIQVNDPVLTAGGTFKGTMDQFIAFKERFCDDAASYWNEAWSNQLINERDLISLNAWGVSTEGVPYLIAVGDDPPDVMARSCASADDGIRAFEDHVRMIREIAYWASYFLVESYPGGVGDDATLSRSEQIGKFLADAAAETLGLGPEIAASHYTTYRRYVQPMHSHLLDNRFSALAVMMPDENIENLEGIEHAERVGRLFGPIIARNIVTRYWGNPIAGFLGGVVVTNPVQSLPLEKAIEVRWDDWESGPAILNGLLNDPAGRREATAADLDRWRANWDIGLRRFQMSGVPSADEDFNHYWLAYRRLADGFNAAQANIAKYQDLIDVVRDFNRSIGHRSLEPEPAGQIVLSPDSVVTRVLARSGTFLPQGAPLLVLTDRFAKIGWTRLSLPDLQASNLRLGDVLYGRRDAESALALRAMVTDLRPVDDGNFTVEFAIDLVVRTTDLLPDKTGFPEYLPMTNRLCDFEVLDEAACHLAANYLATGIEELGFELPN